jgi:hypothetical protein
MRKKIHFSFSINNQVYFILFSESLRTMAENNCYLCQEPRSVVGHNTQSCPNVKCKKCGQNGHILRNCPNLNSNMDQKSVFLDKFELKHHIKEVHLKKNTFDIQCSKCEASFTKKEYLQKHNQKFHQEIKTYKCNKSDDGCLKEIKSEKFVDWILVKILGCPIISRPKLDVKEILKNKSHGIDQRDYMVDPRISRNEKTSDEFIFNANTKINLGSQKLKSSTDRINSDAFQEHANPKISSHEENMDYLHNIVISNDIKSKLEVEQEPMDLYLQDF